MSIFIEKLDGTRYDLKQFGLNPLTFTIDSLAPRHVTEIVEGRSGFIDMGTTLEGRTMNCTFYIRAADRLDYKLARDKVYRLFDARTYFYLIDSQQSGKRWLVKTSDMYGVERLNSRIGSLEIQFVSPSPYAESYGTTLDPFTFDAEKWQVGQGVISEDLVYAHNTTTFRIWNGSDIEIDPREIPLLIKYQGASDNLTIHNMTNGDVWSHDGTSSANDTITLDDVRSLKNGLTIFGNTNRKLITLKKGWNDFVLTGTSSSFLISFDFRFYTI